MTRRKARPRLHESGVAVWNRDGDAGSNGRALSGRELDPLARDEIDARIARVRALG